MGISQASIVFRPTAPLGDMKAFVSTLFASPAVLITPQRQYMDTRPAQNVLVEEFGDVVVVSNMNFAWDLLTGTRGTEPAVWAALRRPPQWMAFCYLDSGGSYGYALYESDRLTRRRMQTTDLPGVAPLAEQGEPLPVERRWLEAPWHMEGDDAADRVKVYTHPDTGSLAMEYDLTAQMLADVSRQIWGMCPWDWETRPRLHFFEIPSRSA